MGFVATARAAERRGRLLLSGLVCAIAALGVAAGAPASASATGTSAWGYNAYGELGNGSTTKSTVPVAVSGLGSGVRSVSAGISHALALLNDGTVKAWGANEDGQLGIGNDSGPETCSFEPCSTKPVSVSGLSGVTAVSGGGAHNLALLSDGTVMAWGGNGSGELGTGTTGGPETCGRFPFEEACSTSPVAVSGLSEVVALSAGAVHSLALLSNGTVMAWGDNENGQLGDGSFENRDTPVHVSGLSGVIAISAGYRHSLALLSSGAVVAWGEGTSGQLGNGANADSDVPVAVSGLSSGVTAVSGGGFHSLALLSDGTIRSWGLNGNGQLGNGTLTSSNVPVTVSGLSGVAAIAAGQAHNVALLSDRSLSSWGWNNEGQLGNGSIGEAQPAPAPVTGASGVTSFGAGGYYSLSYSPPPPTVSGIAPNEGPRAGGTTVTISGTEFNGATAVKFGSSEAASFTVNSDKSISAVSPPGTGTVDVTVTTPGGTSATSEADRFTYVKAAGEGLPEVGRCIKVAGTGAYTRRNCLETSPGHNGAYEWLPGPGLGSGFGAQATSVTLQTAAATVSCTHAQLSGQWSGAKTASVSVTLAGCHDSSSRSCQSSPTAPGEVSTAQALEGELGFISGKGALRPKVGIDLKPKAPATTLVSFTCGGPPGEVGAGELWTLEGSVIGAVKPIDSMKLVFKLLFKARGTRQSPERFEGGVKDTLVAKRLIGAETKSEDAGLTLRGERATIAATNQERLEIKAKV
jgi:alpha-tubulin suppressor-like RCC1 family protein